MRTSLKANIAVLTVLAVGMSTLLPTAEAGPGRGRGAKGTSQIRRSNSVSQKVSPRSNTSSVRRSTQNTVRRITQRNGNKSINRSRVQNTRQNRLKRSPIKAFPKRSIKKTPIKKRTPKRGIKISPVKKFPKRNIKKSQIKRFPNKGIWKNNVSWKNNVLKNRKLKKFPVKKNLKKNFSLKKNVKLKNLVKKHWNQKHVWKGKNLKHWHWGHWNHNNHHHHNNWFHWGHSYWGCYSPWYSHHHGWGFGSWCATGWDGGYCGFGIVIDPCYTYYNPYYVVCETYYEDIPYFDYSQPLVIGDEGIRRTEDGVELVEAARVAFARGEYNEALRLVSYAAEQMPNDPDVHQLRSIILFAMGDFKESAAAANAALSVGQGWSWDAIRSLYGENGAYSAQYRGLEEFVAENPNLPEGRFLLGYHYMMLNFKDAARRELGQAVRLQPKDQVSSTMLKSLSPQEPARPYQPSVPIVPPVPQTDVTIPPQVGQNTLETAPKKQESSPQVTVQRGKLLGNWTASPDAKTKISLGIKDDGSFEWKVKADKQNTELKGTFELDGDNLILKRGTDSQKLEGKVKSATEKAFVFTLIVNGKEAMTFNFVRS